MVIFVAAALLLRPLAAGAQGNVVNATTKQLAAVRTALIDLRGAIAALPSTLRSTALDREREWLLGPTVNPRLAPAPAAVIDEYIETLRQATTLLRQSPSAAIVDDVTAELQAKDEHCRKLRIGMGGSVALTVDTLRDGAPVKNLEVFYLPKLFEHVKGATPTSFPRPSSPVHRDVPPGRYLIWSRNPSTGQTSERKLFDVFGEKTIAVTVPVTFQ
jgi:hypothetical protein